MMRIRVTIVPADGRPQGTTWSPVTPSTPSFTPTKFTPSAQQNTWKPFQVSGGPSPNDGEVILGAVRADPSGGYVHTFGAPKKESSTPQQSSPSEPWPPRQQETLIITSTPRCVQEVIIPTNDLGSQLPVRQVSYQSSAGQSPQPSPVSPVYYQMQNNNGYDNNGSSTVVLNTSPKPSPFRQDSYQQNRPEPVVFRQESNSYQPDRQNSYQQDRQNSYQQDRQNSYQQDRQNSYQQDRQNSHQQDRQNSYQQDRQNSYQPDRQNSYQPDRQNSYQPDRQNSYSSPMVVRQDSSSFPPSRQDSWNQQPDNRQFSPSRQQESWSNQPSPTSTPFSRQESSSNSSDFSQNSVPYQQQQPPPVVRGLFAKQNSVTSSPSNEQISHHEPVVSNSTPQRQSSTIQYQPSPKPYSPPSQQQQQQQAPYTYGTPGPFARQQSSGPQPWSPPAPAESFPTPPPFSPATESAGAPWPSSSELPTPPPPPPPPPSFGQSNNPTPVAAPPPPPPPPPPPMPSSGGVVLEEPAWKKQIKANKEAKAAAGIVPATPSTPSGGPGELPAALANSMKKDKKPFTYLPGGLDLSEIRSPKMQRRLIANQQYAPPPPSCLGQQVLLQPTPNSQMERLNLEDQQQQQQAGMSTAVDHQPQRRTSTEDPRTYGQSRSFRLLQMMTGGDDDTDSAPVPQAPPKKEEDEMRFTGLRRPDQPIPSRAFKALQKMTSGGEDTPANNTNDNRYSNDSADQGQQDDTPVDIRYKGGYIPGRSFKMLQEMTGDDGNPSGTIVPSVLQERRQQQQQQRKAPPHLHLNINNQPPPPKQFPHPSVPASQQTTEEAPKMYTGGRIPSQSFRILQAMTQNPGGEDGTDM